MSLVSLILLIALVTLIVRGTIRSADGRLPPGPGGHSSAELESIREELEQVTTRLQRLEEERDFYKALLEAPDREELLEGPEEPGGP
jgi:hypothetical protein